MQITCEGYDAILDAGKETSYILNHSISEWTFAQACLQKPVPLITRMRLELIFHNLNCSFLSSAGEVLQIIGISLADALSKARFGPPPERMQA